VVCVCEPVQAKADGFLPGGSSLHSYMTPHGLDWIKVPLSHYNGGGATSSEPAAGADEKEKLAGLLQQPLILLMCVYYVLH
jgi:hypothetical protein